MSDASLAGLCERFRKLYLSAVCDALFHLGLEEKVLPSSLRPLFPDSRIVGEAFTVEGHDIPRVGWDEGIERMRPYLEVFERLTPDSVLVSTTPAGRAGHFGELTANLPDDSALIIIFRCNGNSRFRAIQTVAIQDWQSTPDNHHV